MQKILFFSFYAALSLNILKGLSYMLRCYKMVLINLSEKCSYISHKKTAKQDKYYAANIN